MLHKCSNCYYYPVCDRCTGCEYFDPLCNDMDDRTVVRLVEDARKEYYKEWEAYISDFN